MGRSVCCELTLCKRLADAHFGALSQGAPTEPHAALSRLQLHFNNLSAHFWSLLPCRFLRTL